MKLNPKVIANHEEYDEVVVKGHFDVTSWDDFSEDFLAEHIRDIKGRIRYKFIKATQSWGRWIPNRDPDYEFSRWLDVGQKYAHHRGAFRVTVIETEWIKEVKS